MIHITEDQLLTMLNHAWWDGQNTSRYTPNLNGSAKSYARELVRDFREQAPAYADPDFDTAPKQVESLAPKPLTSCVAGKDGECYNKQCPQLRDNEPEATGRHCPLDHGEEDD